MTNSDLEPTSPPNPAAAAPRNSKRRRRTLIISAASAVAVVAIGVTSVTLTQLGNAPKHDIVAPVTAVPKPTTQEQIAALSMAKTLALPRADYTATIPGLIAWSSTITGPVQVGTVKTITPLYGEYRKTAVARLDKQDFLGKPVVVPVIATDGQWSEILTPARVNLPSTSKGNAPAQSAAWVPTANLVGLTPVPAHVRVNLSELTLTVTGMDGQEQTFPVAIGKTDTPTPAGVSGYLEARFVDASQGTGDQPIQMTSLHSQTQDAPVSGGIGGVIAMHYFDARAGAVSHGCLRLSAEAVAALNAIPLGSIVTAER